jgi:hypothetical protein
MHEKTHLEEEACGDQWTNSLRLHHMDDLQQCNSQYSGHFFYRAIEEGDVAKESHLLSGNGAEDEELATILRKLLAVDAVYGQLKRAETGFDQSEQSELQQRLVTFYLELHPHPLLLHTSGEKRHCSPRHFAVYGQRLGRPRGVVSS